MPDRIPLVGRGPYLYSFWTDENHKRGLWRRTTLAEFRKTDPEWEALLDRDELATTEGEYWTWSFTATLPGSHARAVIGLSRGGSDAAVLREFDVETKSFVEDGFLVPEAKSEVEWLDGETLLLQSPYGKDMAMAAGLARTIRLWRRGTPVDRARVLVEVQPGSTVCWTHVVRSRLSPMIIFGEALDWLNRRYWLGDETGPKSRIDIRRMSKAWSSGIGSRGLPGRLAGGPPRRTHSSASRLTPCSPASAIRGSVRGFPSPHRSVFLLDRRAARRGRLGRAQAVLRGDHARRRRLAPCGHPRSPKRSERSSFGSWTDTTTKATAPCSPWLKTR